MTIGNRVHRALRSLPFHLSPPPALSNSFFVPFVFPVFPLSREFSRAYSRLARAIVAVPHCLLPVNSRPVASIDELSGTRARARGAFHPTHLSPWNSNGKFVFLFHWMSLSRRRFICFYASRCFRAWIGLPNRPALASVIYLFERCFCTVSSYDRLWRRS